MASDKTCVLVVLVQHGGFRFVSGHRFSDANNSSNPDAPFGAALPALEGVFFFQLLEGRGHLSFEVVFLVR